MVASAVLPLSLSVNACVNGISFFCPYNDILLYHHVTNVNKLYYIVQTIFKNHLGPLKIIKF